MDGMQPSTVEVIAEEAAKVIKKAALEALSSSIVKSIANAVTNAVLDGHFDNNGLQGGFNPTWHNNHPGSNQPSGVTIQYKIENSDNGTSGGGGSNGSSNTQNNQNNGQGNTSSKENEFSGFGGGEFGGHGTGESWGGDYDKEKAVSTLDKNAGETSQWACARYVRKAMEGGGMNTDGRPNSACDYGPFLKRKGFYPVWTFKYAPHKGDIAVFDAFKSPTFDYKWGHIQMYNGTQWVSDFKQSDFWCGKDFKTYQPHFTIFRW